jgi:hypothetical protein
MLLVARERLLIRQLGNALPRPQVAQRAGARTGAFRVDAQAGLLVAKRGRAGDDDGPLRIATPFAEHDYGPACKQVRHQRRRHVIRVEPFEADRHVGHDRRLDHLAEPACLLGRKSRLEHDERLALPRSGQTLDQRTVDR